MTPSLILALIGFAFASSITPGPNNMMLMASGANFGFMRTLPHMLGVALGFVFLALCVGLGLIEIFERFPVVRLGLTVISAGYLIFLAWKIANAAPPEERSATATPMSFFQACLFQWVNPKAIYMALAAITLYAPQQSLSQVIAVTLIFGAINLPCVSVWVLIGTQLRRIFKNPRHLRFFNVTMAILLIVTLIPSLYTTLVAQ